MTVEVIALTGFEHHGSRKAGQSFPVAERTAELLAGRGLVRISGPVGVRELVQVQAPPVDPPQAAGAKSSASPAAPASGRQTAKRSASGVKRRKAEPS